jgi:hypothetical protein
MSVVQIITAYANLSAATALSTPQGGVAQAAFVPLTSSSTQHAPAPNYCWNNGWMDDNIIALFEADASKYTVTRFSNRNSFQALAVYTPTLYPYLGT